MKGLHMKNTSKAIVLSILFGASLFGCENSNEDIDSQNKENRKDSLDENGRAGIEAKMNEKSGNKYAASFNDSLVVYKSEDLIIQKL